MLTKAIWNIHAISGMFLQLAIAFSILNDVTVQ
jgi:hypothetical protein